MRDIPFKHFRIKQVNNTADDILEPWMIISGESSAVVVTQSRKDDRGLQVALDWRTVSIAHMLEFSDIEMKKRDRNSA